MESKFKTPNLTLIITILLITLTHRVTPQSWDGIIVTEADFQALQSFKQALIDPNGFLKSWNDSGYGACSGGWQGIKCAQGQVIVIQLPWRGLRGQLTTKIGQLQALRKLSLHDNEIGGSIPKELGLLPNLRARGPETPVDWPTRMQIAKGMSRGLHSLHTQHNIIHGNLTSSNVLLDENVNPKIADFGLSRLMTAAANSNVIATAGALGYRAPELSKLKKANTKTDVYSLGVIILELLTGKSPGEAMNGVDLPQWVASIVKEEWTNEVFDLELMKDASTIGDELLNTLKLALHCVDPSPSARPEVQLVLQQLEEIRPETATSSGDDGGAGPSVSE